MKKRILIFTSLLLVAVMLLSGCASHRMMSDGEMYREEYATPTSAAAVEALLGATYADHEQELIYFTDLVIDGEDTHVKHIVYNLKTNAVVMTVTSTLTTSIDVELRSGYADGAFFTVKTTSWQLVEGSPDNYTYKTALCAANGMVVAEAEDSVIPYVTLDLIEFDGKCYRMAEDGTIAHAFDLGDFGVLPELTGKVEDHYYYKDGGLVLLYDEDCKLLAYCEAPTEALMTTASMLENGNVLLQYLIAEPEDAEEFSFAVTGSGMGISKGKYTLVSKLIKPSGSIKDVKLDWFFLQVFTKHDADFVQEFGYADGFDNLGYGFEIVDARLNATETALKLVKLTNSGKARSEVKSVVDGQLASAIDFVGPDRWIVGDVAGRQYLINEKGKVIGEVTGAAYSNAVYFLAAGKLYDYDLNMVYDYEAAKQSLYDGSNGVLRHGVLLEDEDGAVVCYANGTATSVIAEDAAREIVDTNENYFIVKDSTDPLNVKYDVYNDVGAKLVTLDYRPGAVTVFEGAPLLSYTQSDGKRVYYRFDFSVD